MGILPAASVRIFDSSLSIQTTVFPFSARQAPTTSPTYPLPTTAIFMSQQDTDCERVTQGIADKIRKWRSRNCPHAGTGSSALWYCRSVRVLVDYRPALRTRSGVGE